MRPACHSIENAEKLPPAVFSCSKIDSIEPEDKHSLFNQMLNKIRTVSDEDIIKHHNKHVDNDHLGRHQPKRDNDDDIENQYRRGHHNNDHSKHHKKHHGKHHGCRGCKIFGFLMFILIGGHFMCIKALRHHQETFAILTGKSINYKKCTSLLDSIPFNVDKPKPKPKPEHYCCFIMCMMIFGIILMAVGIPFGLIAIIVLALVAFILYLIF